MPGSLGTRFPFRLPPFVLAEAPRSPWGRMAKGGGQETGRGMCPPRRRLTEDIRHSRRRPADAIRHHDERRIADCLLMTRVLRQELSPPASQAHRRNRVVGSSPCPRA